VEKLSLNTTIFKTKIQRNLLASNLDSKYESL